MITYQTLIRVAALTAFLGFSSYAVTAELESGSLADIADIKEIENLAESIEQVQSAALADIANEAVVETPEDDSVAIESDPLSDGVTGEQTEEFDEEPEIETERMEENPVVVIKTSRGDITVELFEKEAPVTVENFLKYVDDGFFAGTIFHRVIPNFMIQGGGFTSNMNQKRTQPPIRNEATNGLRNERGTLAMARTQVIDSATSQFFINLVDNAFLNHSAPTPQGFGYAVFGRVIDGMDVVDEIATVRTGRSGPHSDVPVEPIEILEVIRQ